MQQSFKKITLSGIFLWITLAVFSHCQIPCGIYGDEMRIEMLKEHLTTIEKSMNSIVTLSKEKEINQNQLIRWVSNKEKHADEIHEILTHYFLAQRIKTSAGEKDPQYSAYIKKVELLHRLIVLTMKARQNIDIKIVEEMRSILDNFSVLYFKK